MTDPVDERLQNVEATCEAGSEGTPEGPDRLPSDPGLQEYLQTRLHRVLKPPVVWLAVTAFFGAATAVGLLSIYWYVRDKNPPAGAIVMSALIGFMAVWESILVYGLVARFIRRLGKRWGTVPPAAR